MKETDYTTIRDYTFREIVSCPLKLNFLNRENYNDRREDLFRRKTKRVLRESLAQLYPNIRFTSDRTEKAAEETVKWLKEDTVTICGAVIFHDSIRARIPILVKKEDSFNLVQIHGKAVKNSGNSIFGRQNRGKSIERYLLKAAYRYYVMQEAFPDVNIRCTFLFPLKSYKAETDQLYRRTQGVGSIDVEAQRALQNLFTEADGTDKVREILKAIPSGISHPWFSGDSLGEAIQKVRNLHESEARKIVDQVHLGCRNCSFRKSENRHEDGCWDIHFPESDVQNKHLHLFELIGHHVQEETLQIEKFQEKVTQSAGFSDADKVIHHTGQKISMYHRKAMQLLDAKNKHLPLIFAKPLLRNITNLAGPLHFIDFEAATHPVPDEVAKRPYDPILFQFSCHTLTRSGELVHTQWLDEDVSKTPHADLVTALMDIPDLNRGSIVQFSPFERQAFFKLSREMKEQKEQYAQQYSFLNEILHKRPAGEQNRFIDLSVIIKDGYYNRFMNGGLSLKEILYSVLQAEYRLNNFNRKTFEVSDITLDLFTLGDQQRVMDPYYQISDDRCRIRDGISAMHAYLCMKSRALSSQQTALVPTLLKRYCTLDSLGLYLVFKHISAIMQQNSGGDLVIDG